MIIDDGRGNGKSVAVNEDNRLLVEAIVSSTEHNANHHSKTAYNLLFSVTPAGPGDCFLYFMNDSESDLVIEGFGLWLVANEYIDVVLGDSGDPIGGSGIVPVNLNSGSANTAEGTFEQGNDITGLTGGSIADRVYHASSQKTEYHNFEQDIILVKNGVMTMYAQTGTTALSGVINFNYHNSQV